MLPAPLVIAHRGASAYRPEHTLAAYELAIRQGADYIEPDLVPTRDGVLVARHEHELSSTTDVARHPELAARRTTKVVAGARVTGWFTEDLTLAELGTLRTVERLGRLRPASAAYDGRFGIPTLDEVIDLAEQAAERRGRAVGLYPEVKHPSYFARIGLPLAELAVHALHDRGYRNASSPVFVQCFEAGALRELRHTGLQLVQLLASHGGTGHTTRPGVASAGGPVTTPAGLAAIAQYAQAIGAHKDLIIGRDARGRLLPPSTLVADAHAAGLVVHAWTFRSEPDFLPADDRGLQDAGPHPDKARDTALGEYARFFLAGVDGVLSDAPDHAVAARAAWHARSR